MLRFYCVTSMVLLTGTVAQAGNLKEVSADPPIAPIATPVEGSDWTGFYAGLQFDAVSGNTERDLFSLQC